MGYFDLPHGEVKIKVKEGTKTIWKSIAFTDSLYKEEIAQMWEQWSKKYKILEMQFNGRKIEPIKNYHWELKHKDEVYGTFKTREEAVNAMNERKQRKFNGEKIFTGLPCFVEEIKTRKVNRGR